MTVAVGDPVYFRVVVANTGNVDLTTVSVSDNECTLSLASGDTNSNSILETTETWTYTCSYVVKGTDPDPLVHTALASGVDGDGEPVPQAVAGGRDQEPGGDDLIGVDVGTIKSGNDAGMNGKTLHGQLVIERWSLNVGH